jgi:hypothetical protein
LFAENRNSFVITEFLFPVTGMVIAKKYLEPTNQPLKSVHYKQELVITEFIISKFDCSSELRVVVSAVETGGLEWL